MDKKYLKPGMLVECPGGVAEIIVVDESHDSVIIERQDDHSHLTVACKDIDDQPQLHNSDDIYY